MIAKPTRTRDILNPWRRFRDSKTGKFCTRWYALNNKNTTESIDTRRWK
jgi:hypothetical protein